LREIRIARWLRAAAVGLLALALVGAMVTAGWAAPAATCFGERATITGSGIIDGTAGSDVIVGSDSSDTIDARSGNDLICGLAGDDVLVGGLGNDQLAGGAGADDLVGDVSAGGSQTPAPDPSTGDAVGGGNDLLLGEDGDDIVSGDSFAPNGNATGGGNDQLVGGNGFDRMAGDSNTETGTSSGDGNDLLVGGEGIDSLVGDSHSLFAGDARGAGDDVLQGGPGLDALIGDSEGGNASGSGGDDLLDLGADGGFFALGDHNAPGSAGGTGNDRLIGGRADDFLFGTAPPMGPSRPPATTRSSGGVGTTRCSPTTSTSPAPPRWGRWVAGISSMPATGLTRSGQVPPTTSSTAGPGLLTTATARAGSIQPRAARSSPACRNAPEPLVRSPSPGAYPLPSDEPS
jgi:hypothetical protein